MEEITCSICGKREKKMFATQIKNGYLCTDCAVKADRIIEKKYEEYQYTAEQYKEIYEHPAQAQKIKYIRPKGKKCCIVCGSSKVYGKYVTSDNEELCEQCANNCIMVSDLYLQNQKEFFERYDSNWFKVELSECYNPKYNIAFNFRKEKVCIIKVGFIKNEYQVFDFSDIQSYYVDYYPNMGNPARHIRIEIDCKGETITYDSEESMEKHCEMDKILDCLARIPHLNMQSGVDRECVKQQNSAFHESVEAQKINVQGERSNDNQFSNTSTNYKQNNMNQLHCPKCGGTNVTPIVETKTTGKDFSAGKGCCGFVLLGPIGILCGACGGGKQTQSNTYWMCSNCGNKFQR